MEKLIPIVVALIGAAATIIAAKIKAGRQKEQERAAEAKFATSQPSTQLDRAAVDQAQRTQGVQTTLIFSGSSSFRSSEKSRERTRYQEGTDRSGNFRLVPVGKYMTYESKSVSSVSVWLDGEEVGSGDGSTGFKLSVSTTVGMHSLVFMWNVESERTTYSGEQRSDTSHRRSEIEFVCTQPGPCTLWLNYSGDFGVRRIEPRGAGYVPFSSAAVGKLLAFGIGLIVLSGLVLWFLFSRG